MYQIFLKNNPISALLIPFLFLKLPKMVEPCIFPYFPHSVMNNRKVCGVFYLLLTEREPPPHF